MANDKISHAVRSLVLLHALQSAPPEVHKAILDGNGDEEQLHNLLISHAKTLLQHIKDSAAGKTKAVADDAGQSRAQKARKFVEDYKDAAEPPVVTPQSHVAVAGQPPANESRQTRVGRLFKK